jgi:hypothetical protein
MIAGMKGVRLRERTRSMPELSDTHVLILATDDFEDSELLYPLHRLRALLNALPAG